AVPLFRRAQPILELRRSPDHGQGALGFGPGLRALRVPNGVDARPLCIVQAEETSEGDLLPGRVEYVGAALRGDRDPVWWPCHLTSGHADRKAAVQRHYVADVDGEVDRPERPLFGRPDEILGGGLAASTRAMATV